MPTWREVREAHVERLAAWTSLEFGKACGFDMSFLCKEPVNQSTGFMIGEDRDAFFHLNIMDIALHQGLPYGLIGGHCYSVIRTDIAASSNWFAATFTGFHSQVVWRIAEHDGKKFICCRNPWGKGSDLTICTDALGRSSNKMRTLQRRLNGPCARMTPTNRAV